MKKICTDRKGMTLIELVIAIAIMGIIFIALLSLFGFGYSNIYASGHRTEKAMELQAVIDEFNAGTFYAKTDVISFSDGKGYNTVTDITQLGTKVTGKDINIYVGNEETKSDSPGFQVTVLKFFQNDKFTVRATTFVIKGGF